MTTIKVKVRPSKIKGKAGTIYYQVTHRRIIRHVTTNIHIRPEDWDEKLQQIHPLQEHADTLQKRIDSDVALLQRIIRELETVQRTFSTEEIVLRFRSPRQYTSVIDFLWEQIRTLTDCNQLGTATNYRRATECLMGYLKGNDLSFFSMTSQFIDDYNNYLLRKGLIRNSLSFHMRILRATYNKAVRRGVVEQTFPFRNVYTGIDMTRKRAIDEKTIAQLIRLDIRKPNLSLTRDLFLFSFYTRGMAFIDMAYLRKKDVRDGTIYYNRHKTGRPLIVKIEPCIQEIINRYSTNTPYVFPILASTNVSTSFRQYHTELARYNRRLRQISTLLGLESHLSSYTSRHSWATIARNHNVPLSVISAGMGHTSEKTTQIYLSSLENSVIDHANKGLLESLDKLVSSQEMM